MKYIYFVLKLIILIGLFMLGFKYWENSDLMGDKKGNDNIVTTTVKQKTDSKTNTNTTTDIEIPTATEKCSIKKGVGEKYFVIVEPNAGIYSMAHWQDFPITWHSDGEGVKKISLINERYPSIDLMLYNDGGKILESDKKEGNACVGVFNVSLLGLENKLKTDSFYRIRIESESGNIVVSEKFHIGVNIELEIEHWDDW